jgi:hypothetical protein
LERDVPQLGLPVPSEMLRRFWTMLAHDHGQTWNGAELARWLGVSEHGVRRYLDVLAGTYLVRVLPPWFENVAKRQYKAPKVYVRDSAAPGSPSARSETAERQEGNLPPRVCVSSG